MLKHSCEHFLDTLASGNAVPGGGGASSLCGALGISLGSMVCNLTLGKKKYEGVQEEIKVLVEKADALRFELASLVNADAQAFAPLSVAYGLPKTTPQEISDREAIMATCLKDACDVPMQIMHSATRAISLLESLLPIGAKIALSDIGVGASLCRAALEGASLNVYINTKLMKNREMADDYEKLADEMLAKFVPLADKIAQDVKAELRK